MDYILSDWVDNPSCEITINSIDNITLYNKHEKPEPEPEIFILKLSESKIFQEIYCDNRSFYHRLRSEIDNWIKI